MICLICGKTNEYKLCCDCQTIENLDVLYNEITSFNFEIGSSNAFVQQPYNEYADYFSFCSVIWELVSYFNKDDVLFYYSQYFNTISDWDNFESYAVEYLNKNNEITYKTEITMLYLL